MGFFRDITERKRIEQGLRETEARFAAAFHASPNLIVITRMADGRIVDANEGYTKLLGYSRDESIGKTTAGLSIWANLADRATFIGTLEKFGEITNFETTLRRKDGTVVTVLDSGKTIELQGETCILSVAHDITERKQTEETLRQERNLLRELIDHIPDFIYVRDLSNRFTLANESFARLMGVPRSSALIGKRDADFYPPELAANFDKIDQEVFAGRLVLNRERVLLFPNGQELAVLSTKVPFKNDKGKVIGLIGVGRDITERKQMEEMLRREQELFNCLVRTIPDCIYFKDRQSRFVRINDSMAERFGLRDPAEAVGKTDFDIFSGEHPTRPMRTSSGLWKPANRSSASKKRKPGPTAALHGRPPPKFRCAMPKAKSPGWSGFRATSRPAKPWRNAPPVAEDGGLRPVGRRRGA